MFLLSVLHCTKRRKATFSYTRKTHWNCFYCSIFAWRWSGVMSEREERQPEQLRLSGKRIRWGIMWSILFGARNTTTLKMKILMHELSLGVSLYLLYWQSVFLSLSLSLSSLSLGYLCSRWWGTNVHILGLLLLTLSDVTVVGGSGLCRISRVCLF